MIIICIWTITLTITLGFAKITKLNHFFCLPISTVALNIRR